MKGNFPPKIDIQTRIMGYNIFRINQDFTLISNLHTVFGQILYKSAQKPLTVLDLCHERSLQTSSVMQLLQCAWDQIVLL